MNHYFEIDLGYGRGHQHLKFPMHHLMAVAEPPNRLEPAKEDVAEIRRSVEHPVGTPRLKDIVAAGETVVIIVTDHTRPTPLKKIVPVLLGELAAGGIADKDVTILFAPGTHRPSTAEEMRHCVGEKIYTRIRCLSHDPEDMNGIVSLGASSFGTPIELNRIAVESDIRVAVNIVEPHHSAGWSGGAKNIMPGISSKRSVFQHHAHSKKTGVAIGCIHGNPFKEDIDEIGKTFGVHFSVDVVLTEKFELVKSFAGDLIEANHEAVRYAENRLAVTLPRTADIVVGAVGGEPRDRTLWQAEGKILTRVAPVVRDNGIVILLAECAEGFGDRRFGEILNSAPPIGIIKNFDTQEYTVLGNKAYRLAQLAQKASLVFVTGGIQQRDLRTFPIRFFSTLQEAADSAIETMGADAGMLVVPNAASVLLQVAA